MPTPDFTATELASERTDLALMRNRLAADRTLMAWIRTAMSMITFGFSIHQFLLYLQAGTGIPGEGPRSLGLSLILLGTGGLVAASIQHWKLLRTLDAEKAKRTWSLSLTVASIISLIGVSAFVSVLLRVGPF